jgi:predicted membrane chloride channel (bestrophin family)
VFRNNVSHARYNEARLSLTNIKTAIRTIADTAFACVSNADSDARKLAHKDECREITKALQV